MCMVWKQTCRKVKFKKSSQSAATESDLDHANRISWHEARDLEKVLFINVKVNYLLQRDWVATLNRHIVVRKIQLLAMGWCWEKTTLVQPRILLNSWGFLTATVYSGYRDCSESREYTLCDNLQTRFVFPARNELKVRDLYQNPAMTGLCLVWAFSKPITANYQRVFGSPHFSGWSVNKCLRLTDLEQRYRSTLGAPSLARTGDEIYITNT